MNGRNSGRRAGIILAAGQGKRMESSQRKQFMLLDGKPLIYYALEAFETSSIDDVILVTGEDEVNYCRKQIVEHFGFFKVRNVVAGGKERYHSVYEGLKALEGLYDGENPYSAVLIHDGARPFVTEQIIAACIDGVERYRACVAGMPVKDTIKISDEEGFSRETPKRSTLWQIQTPQAFEYRLVRLAYDRLFSSWDRKAEITDDAMVVETMTDTKVKLIPGDYRNIKITTPEDMVLAEAFLKERKNNEQI